MGLFGNVFGKERCAVCGEEVGALKRRKIADGAVCKDCCKLLSPWFEDRAQSTAEQIRAQVDARARNREELAGFEVTKSFGEFGAVLVDEPHGRFVALADTMDGHFGAVRRIADIAQVADRNPDIVSFSQVRDVDLDILVTSHELKQVVDGEERGFDPPHMRYLCAFTLVIEVDHPYVGTMRVPLNEGTLEILTVGRRRLTTATQKLAQWMIDAPEFAIERSARVYDNDSVADVVNQVLDSRTAMPDYSYGFPVDTLNWPSIKRYEYYLALAGTVRAELMRAGR